MSRNPKVSIEERLRLHHTLTPTSLPEAVTNLELMGVYRDDPDELKTYKALYEKFGATTELRRIEREMDRRTFYPGPQLVTGSPPARAVNFAQEASEQVTEARDLLHQDFDACPRLCWPSLHEAIGHGLLPGQFWSIAASSGHGKTTWCMNLVSRWLKEGRRIFMLPLEQGVDTSRVYLAALDQRLAVKKVLSHRWNELPSFAKANVEAHLLWQETEGAKLFHLHRDGRVPATHLAAIYRQAADFGADVVVVDHLHRIRCRDHNEYADMCQQIQELSKTLRIPTLGMAQMNRGQGPIDRLKPFLIPAVDGIQGGKILEQESHVVLGLYRPLQRDLDKGTMGELRRGQLDIGPYLVPNTVGTVVLKSRIVGEIGTVIDLVYDRGRIVDQGGDDA